MTATTPSGAGAADRRDPTRRDPTRGPAGGDGPVAEAARPARAHGRTRRPRRLGVLVRTELFKISTSRGQRNAVAVFLLLQIPMLAFWGADASPDNTWDALRSRSGLLLAYLLMALGVQVAASEFRWRTATLTWLATPVRRRVLGAQLLAVGGLGAVLSMLTFIAWVTAGAIRHDGATMRLDRPGELLGAYAVVVVTVCAAGVVGVAAGSIARGPSAALLGLLVLGLVELIGDASRFRGPVTSPLGVLGAPSTELDAAAFLAGIAWAAAGTVAALGALRRDLPG
jgi:hypothetical protein